MTRLILRFCTLLCFSLLMVPVGAQIRSGTITGTVTDPSGALVVDATVAGTNVASTTKTTTAGDYTVPYLEAGTYTISVTKAGFETFETTGVRIASSQTARIDAMLRLGSTGTKVEVTATAIQLQTDTSSVSGATTSQVIDAIPK